MNNTNEKSAHYRERIFVWLGWQDTLCPHTFDRYGRYPKVLAVLETSQFKKPIAVF